MVTSEFDWVIAAYPPATDKAKHVLALASMGIGYFLVNPNRMKVDNVIVGFKFVANRPIPAHLQKASSEQAKRLDELDGKRRNVKPVRVSQAHVINFDK